MLAVTDTGSGMPAEVLDRALEPFFTTKVPGRGTGLGLPMVYGFAKQSNGHMKIYSEPGHGTTVRLYLPRLRDGSAAEDLRVGQAASADPGGSETILVVEDDPQVRTIATSHLLTLGYNVLEARDGPAAELLLQGEQPIDLVFTDMVMPGGMSGRELAEQARRHRPGMKILLTTGYTKDAILHQGKLGSGYHLLAKPYRRQELARAVRAALQDSAPAGGEPPTA
jgi:CheY-like chemotaxis protein